MNRTPKPSCAGYSLIEMMVVTAISVILAGMVITDVAGAMPRHRIDQAKQQVIQDLRLARSRAISMNQDIQVTFSNTYDAYTIWTDLDRDGVVDTGENAVVLLDEDVDLWCHPTTGAFNSHGRYESSAQYAYLSVRTPSGYEAVLLTPNGHVGDYSGAESMQEDGS